MTRRPLFGAGLYQIGEVSFALTAEGRSAKSKQAVIWFSQIFSQFRVSDKTPVSESPDLIKSWKVSGGELRLLRAEGNNEFRFSHKDMNSLTDGLVSAEINIINYAISCFYRKLWVHAAALCRKNHLIILVGGSGYGKTTLSLALSEDGWKLFSDDILIISLDESVLFPFPRCPKLRPGADKHLLALGLHFGKKKIGGYLPLETERFISSKQQLSNYNITFFFLQRAQQRPARAESLSITDALLQLSKCSNVLHVDSSLNRVLKILHSASFFQLPAGDLRRLKQTIYSRI